MIRRRSEREAMTLPDSVVEAACRAWWDEGHTATSTWDDFSRCFPEDHCVTSIRKGMRAALEAAAPMLREQWTNELASAIAQANDAAWRLTHTLPQPPKEGET